MNKKRTLFACLMMGVSITSVAAHAQDAGSTNSSGQDAQSQDQAGAIVVTAQRRSQNVLKVPVSVTVVGEQELENRGVNNLSGVTKLAPSLQVAQDNTFSVRGIGTGTFANTVEASVSQVVDDVPSKAA